MADGGGENIYPCLMELAASKIDPEPDPSLAPKFRDFKYKIQSDYRSWLRDVQEKAFKAGTPIRAELMDMVSADNSDLSDAAEAQSYGLNEGRLHPDIYMNELLTSTRVIHQVLAAIMKKLDITPEEFQIDQSMLSKA